MDITLNLLVFAVTAMLLTLAPRDDGKWTPEKYRIAFRFFTVQSNVFCAAACLLTAVFTLAGNVPLWVWLLKYAATAAVTVTLLTVFFYLAPSIGKGWAQRLLTGRPSDLFMHLLTPAAALISFCVYEKRGMSFGQALIAMVPVLLYGILYIRKTQFAPEGKRWEDFYGFNRSGKLPVSMVGMLAGTFLICMGLMLIQNA
jgi:hypothetical protein